MQGPLNLEIRISIRKGGYGQFDLSENLEIDAPTFLEMCEVLSSFHKLAEQFKKAKK